MTIAKGKSSSHWQNVAAWVLIAALVGYGLYTQYHEQQPHDASDTPATQVAESKSSASPTSTSTDVSDKSEKSETKPATKQEATPAKSETKPAKAPAEKAPPAKSSAVEKSSPAKSPPADTPPPKNSSPSKEVASGKTKPTDTRPAPGSSNPRRGVFQNVTIRDQDGDVIYKGEIDLTKSLERIAKDQVISRFRNDGTVFQNREGRLPRQPPGYYHEWVHPTPGDEGPGPQRIVTGEDGDIWYTHDHYKTFRRVPP